MPWRYRACARLRLPGRPPLQVVRPTRQVLRGAREQNGSDRRVQHRQGRHGTGES